MMPSQPVTGTVRQPRRLAWLVLAACLLAAAFLIGLLESGLRRDSRLNGKDGTPRNGTAAQIEQGRHLAIVANCAGCHTSRGGEPYAGGVAIDTPFGSVVTPNITPDDATGIGTWSPDDFWRAMHDGIDRDGRPLTPAFPFTSYRRMARADVDAIYFHLRAQKPVNRSRQAGGLGFPFDSRWALALWRTLYMPAEPDAPPDAPGPQSTDAQLLAYGRHLAFGPGHCSQCHSPRNALGGWKDEEALSGAAMVGAGWYAPALRPDTWLGTVPVTVDAVEAALQSGVWAHGAAIGPMADIVATSLQHWLPIERRALARFLVDERARHHDAVRPAAPVTPGATGAASTTAVATCAPPDAGWGAAAPLYERNCARCHGGRGEGRAGMHPALCGNASVGLPSATNAIRAILEGGYAPSTAANPRPFGMPPFNATLSDDEIAALVSQMRRHWGGVNDGADVSGSDVRNNRSAWRN